MTELEPIVLPDHIVAAQRARVGVLRLVGNTPLVSLDRLHDKPGVRLFAKLERSNPGGSVKDRVALSMIEAAERSGELHPGKTIIEATSGNTGIGLAMVAAVKGYPVVLVMQEAASTERKKILRALGADLVLTPASEGVDGAIEYAYEAARREPDKYFLPDQYNNPNNPLAHYYGTGIELWQQTGGGITHFVAAMGTSGTLMGTGRRLRELSPEVEIVAVEPHLGHRIQGMKNLTEAYIPGIYDASVPTTRVRVDDDVAFETSRRLSREHGIFVGMSAGAAVAGALDVVSGLDEGVVVVLLPDGGERYLSTALFQHDVAEDLSPPPVRLCFLNTLTRRLEPFEPLDAGKARIYACGPTAHALPHLGLMRRMVIADVVVRTLEMAGHDVELVMNITDIDDKTLEAAELAQKPLAEVTARHIAEFHEDMETLNVHPASQYPRASDFVDRMLDTTRQLVDRGLAYEKHKSVYFDISRFPSYGKLSGVDPAKLQLGATVDLDRYDKDNPRDFTLVKRSTLAEIRRGTAYRTEWGQVRPGWHVECAAIAMATLGGRYDIHLGGHDLIFPHHENEIAVCESITGHQPATLWLHSAIVTGEDGKKMSHSGGNAVTVRDLAGDGYTGREIRFYLLQTNYRQPFRFSRESLDAAVVSLRRFDAVVRRLRGVTADGSHDEAAAALATLKTALPAALFEDLNVSAALAELFAYIRRVNRLLDLRLVGRADALEALEVLCRYDAVFGVGVPEDVASSDAIEALVAEREVARDAGDFERADALRDELSILGVRVDDTRQGPRLSRS